MVTIATRSLTVSRAVDTGTTSLVSPLVGVTEEEFDGRTYNYEVANQWTPLAKRFAKIGVYACGNIFHSGRDYHPESKRLTTLAFWKDEKTEAEF